MKKINLILSYLSLVFFGTNCCGKENDNCHETIAFYNNSPKDIYISYDKHYPDTMYFGTYSGIILNARTTKALSGAYNTTSLLSRNCWEANFLYEGIIPADTLMIYIFDAEILENNSWEDVADNYMVLQRYDVSLDDLEQLNWTLTYPPAEAMKNIKMYPAYKAK